MNSNVTVTRSSVSLAVLSWIFLMLTLAYVCYRSFLAFR